MNNSNVRVTIQTDKGMIKRRNDQYSAYLIPDDPGIEAEYGSLTVITDGLGGNINSNFASKISAESFLDFYYEEDSTLSPEKRLLDAFQKTNDKLLQKIEDFHTPGMMSTLTCVLVHHNEVWVIYTGTTRAYLLSISQGLRQITTDNELFLGSSETINPVIKKIDRQSGDRILILTSGVYSQVATEEMKKITQGSNASQVIGHLIQSANHAGGEDNATACLIDFGKFAQKVSVIAEKKEPARKIPKVKPERPKKKSSFWVWILILAILGSLLYITWKYQQNILYFLLPGTRPQTPEIIIENPKPIIVESPEATINLIVNPNEATVFLFEGEVPFNEKQKIPYFSTEKTPTIIKGLKAGSYTLIVEKNGYESVRQVIMVKDTDLDSTLERKLSLKPIVQNTPSPIETPKPPPSEILPPPIPPVIQYEIVVQSDPIGAKILLNSQNTGLLTPNVLKVNPGTYTILIVKDGYNNASRTVTLTQDSNKQTVFMKLLPIPVVVTISSEPSGAKIYLDNIYTGKVTPDTISVGFGTHTITVAKGGFEEQSQIVTTKPGMKSQFLSFVLKLKAGKTLSKIPKGFSYAY